MLSCAYKNKSTISEEPNHRRSQQHTRKIQLATKRNRTLTAKERTSEIFDLLHFLETWIDKLPTDNDSEITKKIQALNTRIDSVDRALLCLQEQLDNVKAKL